MKGSEIINHIARDKMPDIENVREICLSQPGSVSIARRIRLRTAVVFVAALVAFATVAYAVMDRLYQRVETGGIMDIVIFPDTPEGRQAYEEHTADRSIISGWLIYCGFTDNTHYNTVDAETVQFINDELDGQLFAANGDIIDFELLVPASGPSSFRQYQVDDRGQGLYTADGYRIGSILFMTCTNDEPYGVKIETKVFVEAEIGFNTTFEDAVAAFGKPFRLPTAHIDMFQPPRFNLTDLFRGRWHTPEWFVGVNFTVAELNHIRDWCFYSMRIIIERAKDEDDPYSRHATVYFIGGEAIAHDIAGITVYELNLPERMLHFTWMHDGFVYNLYPSYKFTHDQTMDVIRSMIE